MQKENVISAVDLRGKAKPVIPQKRKDADRETMEERVRKQAKKGRGKVSAKDILRVLGTPVVGFGI